MYSELWASLVAQKVESTYNAGDPGSIPGRREWQLTPVFLPGKVPWTEEPGKLQSMGLQRVRHN